MAWDDVAGRAAGGHGDKYVVLQVVLTEKLLGTGSGLSLIHISEAIGIKLDEHGWAQTEDLISGIAKSRKFDMQILEEIVRTDSKQRYSFNEDKTLIRANQGHSIPVDVELEQKTPPDVLACSLGTTTPTELHTGVLR